MGRASVCPAAPDPLWQGRRYAHERIRLAYVSANFNDHAVARLMAGVFEHHDPEAGSRPSPFRSALPMARWPGVWHARSTITSMCGRSAILPPHSASARYGSGHRRGSHGLYRILPAADLVVPSGADPE